jgi:TolB-like protein
MKRFFQKLQRRNVIKSAISYAVFSWVLIQIVAILYPTFGWGPTAIKNTLIALIIGFPVWFVFAYVFEWTPTGFKKSKDVTEEASIAKITSKKLNGIIIAGMALAILLLLADRIFNFTGANQSDFDYDKSIAVLAFVDMSPNKDQEYFSDGISEEILNLLAKIPDLKVISRTSSFSYKDKEINIKKIGNELQVAHVLEGSIRKSGNTFRITAQLIDVKDGAHVWSETYDRDMNDIFKTQDEIAAAVTQQLKSTLFDESITSNTMDPEAYNLYLQAKQVFRQMTAESTKNAELLLRQSIAIDSTYAPTWEQLAVIIYSKAYRYMLISYDEGFSLGIAYAQKAISLDPNYAEAYTRLAGFQHSSWDFTSANVNIKKALILEPNNAKVISAAASNAMELGKIEEAISLELKASNLDPLNYMPNLNLALFYFSDKQYNKAASYMQSFLFNYPNATGGRGLYARILLGQGKNDEALFELEKEAGVFWKLYFQCLVTYAIGNKKEANKLLEQMVLDWGDSAWPNIASVYAYMGEKDEAFKWLDLALDNKDGALLEILNYPEFENLWGDLRWNTFINKLGLPKDHGFHLD